MTRSDIIKLAFVRLGITAVDDSMTAEQADHGGNVLDSLFDEIGREATIPFALSAVPAVSARALGNLLACDLAPDYMVPAPEPRGRAWVRFMATIRSDDRADVAEPSFY